jgi:hypothetical protein
MIEDMLADMGCEAGKDSLAVADALAARGVPFVFCTGKAPNGAPPSATSKSA